MRFLLTKELGRLVRWLRILGFDTEYYTSENKSSLIIMALREDRIIVTRNTHLTKSAGIHIVEIKEETIKEQVKELKTKLNLKINEELIFSRCIICNEPLISIEKDAVKEKVPEYVFKTQEIFYSCPKCQRIYWQGTHWGNVKSLISRITTD